MSSRFYDPGMGEQIVHVIPLEDEIDRAVRPFEEPDGFRANRVYILATIYEEATDDGTRLLRYYHGEVVKRFEGLGIETVTVFMNIWDMLDVIGKVSSVVKREREKGNIVYVNMSAGGPFVSVGAALSAMVQGARLYYVRCKRYSETREEKLRHGNAIGTTYEIHFLENFSIGLPDERGVMVLMELYNRGSMRTSELLAFLHGAGVEGFEADPARLPRGEKISLLMRLNKGITGKLEDLGYISKRRRGRENEFRITESGKYVACISGLLPVPQPLEPPGCQTVPPFEGP